MVRVDVGVHPRPEPGGDVGPDRGRRPQRHCLPQASLLDKMHHMLSFSFLYQLRTSEIKFLPMPIQTDLLGDMEMTLTKDKGFWQDTSPSAQVLHIVSEILGRPYQTILNLSGLSALANQCHVMPLASPGGSVRGERANFTWLVLGCVEADFCNQIFVGKLSPISTQCTPFYNSQISN